MRPSTGPTIGPRHAGPRVKFFLSFCAILGAGLLLLGPLAGCKEARTALGPDDGDSVVKVDTVPKDTVRKDTIPKDTAKVDTTVKDILDPRIAAACFENPPGEKLNQVSEAPGAINLYFNKSARTDIPGAAGNEANYNVNLEKRLLHRLAGAMHTIDLATYEINLPRIIEALIAKAAEGVRVRVVADAKAPADEEYEIRYDVMRGFLERLVRGRDGKPGNADDVLLFADSPILALTDTVFRKQLGLPLAADDLPEFSATIGNSAVTGRRLALGEEKSAGAFYSASNQMHNKFAVVDGEWVFSGSWNFTLSGLYGDEKDYLVCGMNGSQQHSLELRSPEVAAAYKKEFEEMWGGATGTPDPVASDYHGRKADNTPHLFEVGGRKVEVYFSPGDGAVERMVRLIREEADSTALFAIYAWSDQALVDELKLKWEGSRDSAVGTRTDFKIRGLFDASFWNQWWSASVEMTGRIHATTSINNPGRPWKNPAPVCRQGPDSRKLHSKTMVLDADTDSDPTVIIGSTNWSTNGEDVNDENMVILRDRALANQVRQEFEARWVSSGCRE